MASWLTVNEYNLVGFKTFALQGCNESSARGI